MQPAAADLVPLGANWKYLDDGTTPQSGWQSRGFNDNAWPGGFGELGYGDGDEVTVLVNGAVAVSKPITTYFRHQFDVSTLPSEPLTLRVRRDAGVVVYLNGEEVFRDNMPAGAVNANTRASAAVLGPDESRLLTTTISPQSLELGTNILAAEVHLTNRSALDLSFDLQLTDSPVVRGPYLQQSSATGIVVRWRTDSNRDSVFRYGTNPDNLDRIANNSITSTEHSIRLTGLTPDTRYYYSIGDSGGNYTTGDNPYFDTHPATGSPAATRIWVLGDSGTADANAAAVRNAFTRFNGGTHADVLLMLGDNAYDFGTDDEYQAAVFDMYPDILRNSVIWPTLGNHDAHSADSESQSGDYYDIFTLPSNAESGGVASGTEAYYSFDYANIHFVSLDSHDTNRSVNGAMATWLENDLAANTQEWLIAFWHHPPYSKGSHDSDAEWRLQQMRENFLPILESHGVDLVLAGHSHSYERSMLIDGHYGTSDTFSDTFVLDAGDGDSDGDGAYTKQSSANTGSVYSVTGSSGQISNAPLDHPVMVSNLIELGSMVVDVNGNTRDAIFMNDEGSVLDSFRIVHPSDSGNSVVIGTVALDHDRVTGSRWTRINFNPITTGTHTINLSWSGNADIRYTLFRDRPGTSAERIETINSNSPAAWTGVLDNSEQYYLGVWSASGSANVTATLETDATNPEPFRPADILIGQGTLDATRNQAPRWVRLDFESVQAGDHTISVLSTNDNADVRFRVNRADGTNVSSTIRGTNPGVWEGTLEANTSYFIGVWNTDGITDYTATIRAR